MTTNPYLQPQYFTPAKPNAVAAVDGQIPQQKPITYGGMVPVSSIEEVLKYPVQPGICIHFKDENADYIYTKTQGFSQMEKPVYEAYMLQKVDFEPLLPENKKLANYVTVEQMSELTGVLSQLTQEVMALKQQNTGNYHKKFNKQRRDDNESTTKFRPGTEMREN